MIAKSPCDPKCPKRNAFCHTNCPEWEKYEAQRDAVYAERRKVQAGKYAPLNILPKKERAKILNNRRGRF